MEDTLSFEDMATKVEPFDPPYTEEFRQYMQESVNASRKAHAEAVQSISNIIMIEGNAISIANKEMEELAESNSQISVPRWFLKSLENTLRIQHNINLSRPECCQSRNIKGALNGVRKLLKGEELTGMERLEQLESL